MLDLAPVASATPDGDYHVDRAHRWLPDHVIQYMEDIEDSHREQIARNAVIIKRDFNLVASSNFESSRRATIEKFGTLVRRDNRAYSLKSRGHELHKSKLRRSRRATTTY